MAAINVRCLEGIDLDKIPVAEGLEWRPVRRRFDVRAFGVNAYTVDHPGGHVVEEHDELGPGGAGGHEELYVVLRGHATFTIDGDTIEAPAGTLVFIRDPALKRVAIAEQADTAVLAVGGAAGKAYEVSPWEYTFASTPLLKAGRAKEAEAILLDGLAHHPGNPAILYNLACAEALAGEYASALVHLRTSIETDAKYAAFAKTDPDFDALRREPGFPA